MRKLLVAVVLLLTGLTGKAYALNCGTAANGTPMTTSQLIATFPDNGTPGNITPGCYRNVVASTVGTSSVVSPLAYGTITDGGTFGDGLAHPASSNGFATLGALQAVYTFATATSNDMAGLMIQAAINDVNTKNNGAVVSLPAGSFRVLPAGIVLPSNFAGHLWGAGRQYTQILCVNAIAGSSPCVTVNQQSNSLDPVAHLALLGLAAISSPTIVTPGVAVTTMYTAGSTGLFISKNVWVTYDDIALYNFDTANNWDLTNGNTWGVHFRNWTSQYNNKGYTLDDHVNTANSFEHMSVDNFTISNNNYGVYFIAQTSTTSGAGSTLGGDLYFNTGSFDYNIVQQVFYLGGGWNNTFLNTLFITNTHLENDDAFQGNNYRILSDGSLFLDNNMWYDANTPSLPTVAAVRGDSFWSHISAINQFFPDANQNDNTVVPFISGSNQNLEHGAGNFGRSWSNMVLAAANGGGNLPALESADPGSRGIINGNTTIDTTMINQKAVVVTANATISFPTNTNSPMPWYAPMKFIALPGATGTFSATGITLNGTTTTVGGVNGGAVTVTKTGTNTWTVTP